MLDNARCINAAKRALICVYVHKMVHDNGRLEEYAQYGPKYVDCEADFESAIYGLDYAAEMVWEHASHDEEVRTLYFSSTDMMEYYRLCRVYGKKHGVKLSANPYMLEAKRLVDDCLDQGCPVCEYRLQTKINHKWASGIVFRMWPEFEWHFALLTQINRVFGFYTEQLQKLKKALEMPETIRKEAA